MKILLFASGIGDRWKGPMVKQLAQVAGKPVIVRTIEQLQKRGLDCTVITFEESIEDACRGKAELYYSPPSTKWPNTFLDSEPLWEGRVLPLHADVVWDDHALDIVLGSTGLGFYGTRKGPWENFAIAFDPNHYEKMKDAARLALSLCPGEKQRCGTWETYRALVGIPLTELHTFEDKVWHELKTSEWSDYTYDFDKLEHYNRFLMHNQWAK